MESSFEGEPVLSDIDALLLHSLDLSGCNLADGSNSSLAFDVLSSDIPDNVVLGELESLINVPVTSVSTDYCPPPVAAPQQYGVQSSAHYSQPQMATWAGNGSAGPVVLNASQMSHHVLTNSLTASNVITEETVGVQQAGANDLSGQLLKLLIHQQMQQNEQQRILENLQKAILRGDADRNTLASPAACAVLAPAPVPHKVSPGGTNGSVSTLQVQLNQPRSEQIRALLEDSPPAPNGTVAMQQYAHLSQNELRKALLSTDCQQQMKRGTNRNGNVQPQQSGKLANGSCSQLAATVIAPLRPGSSVASGVAQPLKSEPSLNRQRVSASASAFACAIDAESDYGDGQDDTLSSTMDTNAASFADPAGSLLASASGCVTNKSAHKHNVIEKRYRFSINDRIDELRQLVAPCQPMLQKSAVLRNTIDYIHHLRSHNAALRHQNAALRTALARDHRAQTHVEADTESLIPPDSPLALDLADDAIPSAASTTGRTQMLLCVAMLTLVVANPLILPFSPFSHVQTHAHAHADFATPHVGARLLNSLTSDSDNLQSDRTVATFLPVLLLPSIFCFLFVALYCALPKRNTPGSSSRSVAPADRFHSLKMLADRQLAARQFEQAGNTYAMALEAVQCLPRHNALRSAFQFPAILCFSLLRCVLPRRIRSRTGMSPVPLVHLYSAYSRLLSTTPDVHRMLAVFRAVLRFDTASPNEHLAQVYLSLASGLLRCAAARHAAVRFLLGQVAALALFHARCSTSNSVVLHARFFHFLSSCAHLHQPASTCSLTDTLTAAYLRSLVNRCFAALRNGNAAVARWQLDELTRVAPQHGKFWRSAATLFELHYRHEQSSSKPFTDCLRQQSLADALDQLGRLLGHLDSADWLAVADASPRAVTVVHLLYSAVRSLALLDAGPCAADLQNLRAQMNALSSSLQLLRTDAAADALDLDVAWCAARCLLTLRMLLHELHQKGASRKCIGEYQRDLDTLSTLKERCRDRDRDNQPEQILAHAHSHLHSHSTMTDERETLFKTHLHQLCNSNPLGDVLLRLRLFGQ